MNKDRNTHRDAEGLRGNTAIRALECLDEIAQQRGLDDVSMRQVAACLGLSLAALQYHYPTKGELLDAYVKHSLDIYREKIDQIAADSGRETSFVNVLEFIARETLVVAKGGALAMIESRAIHDEASRRAIHHFSKSYIETMNSIIGSHFPTLTPEESLLSASLVCAQLEGISTIFEPACSIGADPSTLLAAVVQSAASIPSRLAASKPPSKGAFQKHAPEEKHL